MFKINNKNKIIFILSIVFLTLLCLTTFSEASYDVEFEGNSYTIPDFPDDGNKYKIVCLEKASGSSKVITIKLFTSSEKFVYGDFSDGYIIFPNYKSYSCSLIHNNTSFSFNGDYPASGSTSNTFKNIVYSNYDVYDEYGKLVFQAPPQVNPTLTETLVEETTQAQITQQIQTMILGFLKYLTLFVVSVIAFYKGWKFLSTQLKRA
ncbi:MAG: hypothetical protein ACLTKT_00540 [Clostridia bacterium]